MGLGYVEGITHDYKRHGTTTLFAALDVANGEVIALCKPRHRYQGSLTARPFLWTATAESILARIERLCKVIGGTQH
jgi:transposase